MKCPICDLDLSPLDLISRTEHVDLCIENGPSVVEVNDTGQLVVKRNLPPNKQRKICPICDKTFTTLTTHFKTCALKHDVPPDLMLSHWDSINCNAKNPKKFPPDLLQSFIAKCVKEGRLGEQVDFARALVLSMTSGDAQSLILHDPNILHEDSTASTSEILTATSSELAETQRSIQSVGKAAPCGNSVSSRLMTAATSNASSTTRAVARQKYRIEVTDELNKQANIALRISRELAASRNQRYRQQRVDNAAVANEEDDEEVAVVLDDNECVLVDDDNALDTCLQSDSPMRKLFYRARMKMCSNSDACQLAKCDDHDLELMLDDFKSYTGAPMNSTPQTGHNLLEVSTSIAGTDEPENRAVDSESSETLCDEDEAEGNLAPKTETIANLKETDEETDLSSGLKVTASDVNKSPGVVMAVDHAPSSSTCSMTTEES